eukprot:14231932-Alexandrium_andersonii.AAC.1
MLTGLRAACGCSAGHVRLFSIHTGAFALASSTAAALPAYVRPIPRATPRDQAGLRLALFCCQFLHVFKSVAQ